MWRWRNERVERDLMLMRLENTPGGRVMNWLWLRVRANENGNEGENERWNERETRLSRPSNTPGGREERLL